MKTLALSSIFILITLCLFAQDKKSEKKQGIYLTSDDYKTGQLVAFDKIQLNHLISGRSISIIKDGKKTSYYKDSIFGYKDENNKDWRFFKKYNEEYQILENRKLVVYAVFNPEHNSKGISGPEWPSYYFSTGLSGNILPLTILNLKKAYSENIRFHDALDITFGDGTPVSSYDKENKMYKVNYLLNNSLTQKNY